MKPFYVYMLQCADQSYYCGQTDDLEARMHQHSVGGDSYTATRKPVKLIWQGEFETREAALQFEQKIKGWSRAKKEALIAGDWDKIKELAKSKRPQQNHTAQSLPDQAEPFTALMANPTKANQTLRQAQGERTGWQSVIAPNSMGQRRAMAKAITLLESTRPDHRAQADELLTALLPHTGKSFRLGISGVPGVGKSTFIEALGLHLIAQGHRVAVLTIDPSSSVSGGSILGDKTRMEMLSVHEKAFIRPSPSSGTLGGVASSTREAMLVCEAAGYDIVIVETVGVGQSEIAVAGMTDVFVLMQLPNAGDDLQAIKKGVMELADLVLINKADIDPDAATRAQAQIVSSMRIFEMHGHDTDVKSDALQRVMLLSALKGIGVTEFWETVAALKLQRETSGQQVQRRQQQAVSWMWERIETGLKRQFMGSQSVRSRLMLMQDQVRNGGLPASVAARQLLELAANGEAS
jgi:LAO/AO transport system kinase